MKSKLELKNIAAMVTDDIVSVRCSFAKNSAAKTYTFLAGCMITFEGHRIPADRVWFEPKN